MDKDKRSVLLLDDEKFLLDMYKRQLEKHGFNVTVFFDVDTALGALRLGLHPDVILFDITMPDSKSGYEFIETVKKERLAKHAIKLALTNEGQDAVMMRIEELGANGHLLKAKFLPKELAETVSKILEEKRSHLFGLKL
jgi:CheY-like chemotaxis protein